MHPDKTGQCRFSPDMSADVPETKPHQPGRRLDSWKEIAAFFGRDERTVRRWEKESALPVHRVPGSVKARVFAYEGELSRWLSTPQATATETSEIPEPVMVIPSEPEPASPPQAPAPKSFPFAKIGLWAAFGIVAAAVGLGLLTYRKSHGFAVHAANDSRSASTSPSAATSDAEDFYLKGRYYWNKRTPADLNRAVDYFTQAIVRDPNYAPGYIGLADCYNLLREFSAMPADEAYPRALAAAQKAVELAPNSAEAHNSLAFASFWGFLRVADADREFRRALELEPNNTRAHHWYATFLAEMNRLPEALNQIERARQLDPASTPILADKGFVLGLMGQQGQAVALLKQIETAEPDFLSAHLYLSDFYFDAGDYAHYLDEARAVARIQHDGIAEKVLAAEQQAYREGGSHQLLETKLKSDQELYDRGEGSDFQLAQDYSVLSNREAALRHLQAAVEKHDPSLPTLLVNGSLKNIRQEPAFREMLIRSGLLPAS
ncbi:MAG: tetratricopeptide repeat protein [Acidobacteriales bacterium]|nr:tetratricopeptide repeat protein [Terriglobales bacterium]